MKDLLVITADADTRVVMQAVLSRPQSLGIRPLTFDVRRHDGRDSGVFRDGPELVRNDKPQYARLLLLWDHHGSGQERRLSPEESAADVQGRLNSVTWKDRSAANVLVPELEEWLWHCPAAIGAWIKENDATLDAWQEEFARASNRPLDEVHRHHPKELLHFVCRKSRQRIPVPRDYESIAQGASLTAWRSSPSFNRLVVQIQGWFPTMDGETSLPAG